MYAIFLALKYTNVEAYGGLRELMLMQIMEVEILKDIGEDTILCVCTCQIIYL